MKFKHKQIDSFLLDEILLRIFPEEALGFEFNAYDFHGCLNEHAELQILMNSIQDDIKYQLP